MSGVNKVILVGNVGRDPELRTLGSGAQMAGFSLATSRSYKDKHGQRQEKTQWHRIVAWDKQAELCASHVKKGESLYVEGELTYREYEVDGYKRQVCEVRMLQVAFVGGRKAEPASHSAAGVRQQREPAPAAAPSSRGWGGDLGEEQIPF